MRAKWIWRIIGIVGFGLFLSACHQNGTVFAVDTTDDTVDVTPGDGICADAAGDCSLRAAIIEANALPGVEEIALVDGATYQLTLPGGLEDQSFTGDLDIRSAVVITGDGTILGDESDVSMSVDAPSGLTEFDGPNFDGGFHGLEILNGSMVSVRHADFTTASVLVGDGDLSVWSSSFASSWGDGIRAEAGNVRLENVSMVGQSWSVDLVTTFDAAVVVVSSTLTVGRVEALSWGEGSIAVQSSVLDIGCRGNLVSLGHNMVRPQGGCGSREIGDVDGPVYPTTQILEDNGGPVLTVQVDPYGPAVDGGLPTACTLSGEDARGVARPFGPACDIGAMELEYGADCESPGPGADLRFCDFEAADLSGLDLSGADAWRANFDGADLSGATLVDTTLARARVDGAVFDDADLTDADMSGAIGAIHADRADFTRASLVDVTVGSATGAHFTDADARGLSATWRASFAETHIEGADFTGAYFGGVTSGGITGSATFSEGVGVVNGRLIAVGVELTGLDFSGADFSSIGVVQVPAQGTDFTGATLTYSIFASSFRGATLDDADLSGTQGRYVDLRFASVAGADLSGAQMMGSNWTEAVVVGTDFTDADLSDSGFRDAVMLLNTWDNTTCPSGVNSDDNGGDCDGQFLWGYPVTSGGAATGVVTD